MLRRLEDQGRVKDGEAKRREDLNEEQRSRSLRGVGETACKKLHLAFLCRSAHRVMSSDVSCGARRAACASAVAARVSRACIGELHRHGCLYRSSRVNVLRSRRGDRSTLVFRQTPQGISKISTWLAMPRSERFSGVAAMPFDCNNFEASLSVTTPLVAKMARDVASPCTRAAILTVRPK
jgi:hypothetical protein